MNSQISCELNFKILDRLINIISDGFKQYK